MLGSYIATNFTHLTETPVHFIKSGIVIN